MWSNVLEHYGLAKENELSRKIDGSSYRSALEDELKRSKHLQEQAANNINFNHCLGYTEGIEFALRILDGFSEVAE